MRTKEHVISAGQATAPLSTTLARAGWKAAFMGLAQVGGTCVNEGCAPTKTMVASARVAYLADIGIPPEVFQRLGVPFQPPFEERYWIPLIRSKD